VLRCEVSACLSGGERRWDCQGQDAFLGFALAVGFWSPSSPELGEVGEAPTRDDLVDDPVVLGLLGCEDEVPVGVPRVSIPALPARPGFAVGSPALTVPSP